MNNILKMFAVFVLLLAAFSPSQAMGQFFEMTNSIQGQAAPDFTLDTLKQKGVNFTSYRAGAPAIVFFWATWCPHCRNQLTQLNAKAQEITDKGIKLVLVDLGETPKEVEAYVKKNGITAEMFLDQEGEVSELYGVIGVPTYYFVDKDGVVLDVQHGLPENYEAVLKPNAS